MGPGSALSRDAVRELDRRAIEDYGIPSICLMESAGRACADEVQRMLGPSPPDGVVQVLCGPGNNGGDGFVVARTLANRGVPAEVTLVGELERLEGASEDVRTNARLWRSLGNEIRAAADEAALEPLARRLAVSPLVVDALFGTGLTRALRPPFDAAVREANASGRPVLAVDVPSGLDADTGEVLGAAVRAAATVTFVVAKPGFFRAEGPERCGRLVVAEIGVPRAFVLEALERAAS